MPILTQYFLLSHWATSRKVAGSIPFGVDSASNKWVQRIFPGGGGKGGRCVGLTTLSPLCADCLEILGASTSYSPQILSRPVQGLLYFHSSFPFVHYSELYSRLSFFYLSSNSGHILFIVIHNSLHLWQECSFSCKYYRWRRGRNKVVTELKIIATTKPTFLILFLFYFLRYTVCIF